MLEWEVLSRAMATNPPAPAELALKWGSQPPTPRTPMPRVFVPTSARPWSGGDACRARHRGYLRREQPNPARASRGGPTSLQSPGCRRPSNPDPSTHRPTASAARQSASGRCWRLRGGSSWPTTPRRSPPSQRRPARGLPCVVSATARCCVGPVSLPRADPGFLTAAHHRWGPRARGCSKSPSTQWFAVTKWKADVILHGKRKRIARGVAQPLRHSAVVSRAQTPQR